MLTTPNELIRHSVTQCVQTSAQTTDKQRFRRPRRQTNKNARHATGASTPSRRTERRAADASSSKSGGKDPSPARPAVTPQLSSRGEGEIQHRLVTPALKMTEHKVCIPKGGVDIRREGVARVTRVGALSCWFMTNRGGWRGGRGRGEGWEKEREC